MGVSTVFSTASVEPEQPAHQEHRPPCQCFRRTESESFGLLDVAAAWSHERPPLRPDPVALFAAVLPTEVLLPSQTCVRRDSKAVGGKDSSLTTDMATCSKHHPVQTAEPAGAVNDATCLKAKPQMVMTLSQNGCGLFLSVCLSGGRGIRPRVRGGVSNAQYARTERKTRRRSVRAPP